MKRKASSSSESDISAIEKNCEEKRPQNDVLTPGSSKSVSFSSSNSFETSETTAKGYARGRGRPIQDTPKVGRLESVARPSTSSGRASQWFGRQERDEDKMVGKKSQIGSIIRQMIIFLKNYFLMTSSYTS